jgi:hypothetical protein
VVERVQIEHDEVAVTGLDVAQQLTQFLVEGLMQRLGVADDLVRDGVVPDLEVPTEVGAQAHRVVFRSVQVELEARAVGDDPGLGDLG